MAPDRVGPAASVVALPVLDEVVLVDVETGESCALDTAGAQVWSLLAEVGEVAEVARRLAGASGAGPEQVQADLDGFIADLTERGFVERRPPDPGGPDPAGPAAAR
jgi:hypothetical protein